MEWFNTKLKYFTPPAYVNAHSLDFIMDMYVPICVKERTKRQRGCNPGQYVHVLSLHQKMLQVDGWERFSSNGYNKNNLIALFVNF